MDEINNNIDDDKNDALAFFFEVLRHRFKIILSVIIFFFSVCFTLIIQ